MLLCTMEVVNEKSLKKNDNLLSRYKIARGRKTKLANIGDKSAILSCS